jgi:hypothetical protein
VKPYSTVGQLGGLVRRQDVAGLPREEQRTDDHVALIQGQHQEAAQQPGGRAGVRLVQLGEAARDRQQHAAHARRVRRNQAGQEHVGCQ